MVKRLSSREHWDAYATKNQAVATLSSKEGRPANWKAFVRHRFPDAPWNEALAEHCRWRRLDSHLPRNADYKVVEIGCAPGTFLCKYHDRYGYQPWGIEYSETGVQATHQTFAAKGLDADRIVHADFFASEVLERFSGAFDVVTSHGFLEHFADPGPVVARHVELLRPGGWLVVSIPNFRGFNYWRVKFSYPELLPLHNLEIMKRPAFRALFEAPELDLKPVFADYFGIMSLRNVFPRWMAGVESLTEKLAWLVARDRRFDTALFSPHMMYIGQKAGGSPEQAR